MGNQDAYYKAIAAPGNANSIPPTWTPDEIRTKIEVVNEILKGPMSNVDRVDAYQYRKDLNARLLQLQR